MTYKLKAGEEIRDGKLYGWTGREHAACNGTGEDFSDDNAPDTTCRGCGGTGEEWGLMPDQPAGITDLAGAQTGALRAVGVGFVSETG